MGRKYRFKTKPYQHQVKALRKLLRSDFGGALLMEPRTGKTKVAIDYMSALHLKHGLQKVLVVCPHRVMGVWIREIRKHCPYDVQVIVWDAKARKHPISQPNGHDDLTVVLVNYDAFKTPGKKLASGRRSRKTGRFKSRSMIYKWINNEPALCVLDESHKIKSPSGKTSLMIVSMQRFFKWRIILTGTVVTKAKRIHDIYMQWKFLNPSRFEDLETAKDFRDYTGRWIEANGFPMWTAPKQGGIDDVRRRIHKDSFAVHREDCFDLPPREDVIEYVKIAGETARVYDELSEEMVAMLENGEITEASFPIVLALRLAQITGGTTNTPKPDVRTFRIGSEKLRALEPHLEQALDLEEKLVIAARFKPDLDSIFRMCRQMGLLCLPLRGGVSRVIGDERIRRFRNHDGAAVFLMQPQAGSLGIDLSSSAKMIWYSLTPSYVDFTQSCDRIALSRNSTTFVYLLAEHTVDQVIYDALQSDGKVAKAITTDPRKLLRK